MSAIEIGSGKYGTVYKICMNKECHEKIARKNSTNNLGFEYRIMKLVNDVAPDGVVTPLKYEKKNGKNVLFLEYVNLNNKKKVYSLEKVKYVLKRIIETLIKIQKKYPTFRHNDLHWDNVFNSKDGKQIYLGDFGFANIQKQGYRNPIVQDKRFVESHGIGPKQNKSYDIALLLNDIYLRGTPEIKKFISTLVPQEYLQDNNEKVISGRMRYNVNHSKFPSLKKILYKL